MWLNKKCVMLSTNEKATDKPFSVGITLCNDGKLRIGNPVGRSEKRQHLYIVSDEQIKEGEYGLDIRDNKIFNCERVLSNRYEQGVLQFQKSYCKKIIATTDKSITINGYDSSDEDAIVKCYLPQLSQEFIELYFKKYNEGNMITEVEIEYQSGLSADEDNQGNLIPEVYLKIKNNEVTVKEVQVEYSRNLLCNMQYYMEYCLENGYVTPLEWLNSHKHYNDYKELKTYTEEEIIDLIKFMKTYNGLSTNTTPEFIFKQWKTK